MQLHYAGFPKSIRYLSSYLAGLYW